MVHHRRILLPRLVLLINDFLLFNILPLCIYHHRIAGGFSHGESGSRVLGGFELGLLPAIYEVAWR
jgi:hypothetical protein